MNAISAARDVLALTAAIAESSAAGMSPSFLFFWGHRASRNSLAKSCFSQWYEAAFTVEGERHPTAEHFMMARKAALFGDETIRTRILRAPTPLEAKQLGRRVANFDETVWERERFAIVVAANHAKFSQNPALRAFLLATRDKVLAEASPLDSIWGIGLAADHPDAAHPARWPGLNLLGFALMEVRARLA
jgi:ribA/ribD-fused uncharacterized protein